MACNGRADTLPPVHWVRRNQADPPEATGRIANRTAGSDYLALFLSNQPHPVIHPEEPFDPRASRRHEIRAHKDVVNPFQILVGDRPPNVAQGERHVFMLT
jgi:hypothetical protein